MSEIKPVAFITPDADYYTSGTGVPIFKGDAPLYDQPTIDALQAKIDAQRDHITGLSHRVESERMRVTVAQQNYDEALKACADYVEELQAKIAAQREMIRRLADALDNATVYPATIASVKGKAALVAEAREMIE